MEEIFERATVSTDPQQHEGIQCSQSTEYQSNHQHENTGKHSSTIATAEHLWTSDNATAARTSHHMSTVSTVNDCKQTLITKIFSVKL